MPPLPANALPGFGLGLRAAHFEEILAAGKAASGIDWFEILSENYMVPGGQPLAMLDRIRQQYPVAMHGVSLSVGTPEGPSTAYLRALKALADRVQALWVSDHLCWTGAHGHNMHDLLPLPYTEESLAIVVRNVRRVQDYLERSIVLENVSSYLSYSADTIEEWDFVAAVAEESDSFILLDLNNVYVSSVNHGFDPGKYLESMPVDRVRQIHLAGHTVIGAGIIDSHDQAVADPVWDLYADAVRRFGPVPTMIERDEIIPPLAELVKELKIARSLSQAVLKETESA